MQDLFFQNLGQNLIESDFLPANAEFSTETFAYFKNFSGVYYFILIFKEPSDKEQIKNNIKLHEDFFSQNFKEFNANKILFLRVFCFEKFDQDFFKDMQNNFDINSDTLFVDWALEIGESKILARKNQISEILNIKEIINSSFSGEKSEFYEKEKKFKKLEYKSSNISLTLSLILVNFFIYIFLNIINKNKFYTLVKELAITPEIFYKNELYRLVTAMFLHSNISHLLANIISLYIFGSLVERYMGKLNFFIYYFLGGVFAGITSAIFTKGISIGASGAIFALEGAAIYFMFNRKTRLGQFDFNSLILILILGISMGFLQKNVDNFGHIGGLLSGIILHKITQTFHKIKAKI